MDNTDLEPVARNVIRTSRPVWAHKQVVRQTMRELRRELAVLELRLNDHSLGWEEELTDSTRLLIQSLLQVGLIEPATIVKMAAREL